MCRTCKDSHLYVGILFVGMLHIPTFQCYFWLQQTHGVHSYNTVLLCVRPLSMSLASPEDFKLGRAAMAGPDKKPERDSRGHGYSWRDLVQRICNLHFKHTLKSVPGRQPRSALTLVAGGPRWWSDTFSFKTAHRHPHRMTTHRSADLTVFIALLCLTPLLLLSLCASSVFMFCVFVNDLAKSWSSLYRENRSRSRPSSWMKQQVGGPRHAEWYEWCSGGACEALE